MKHILAILLVLPCTAGWTQDTSDSDNVYKKRVLETTEVDILSSFYSQDGENAAVTAGTGSEELTDFTATYVISIPLSADNVLTVNAGISAYTSASSSNVDPFDKGTPDAFQASSGASGADTWTSLSANYSHSSDDRNTILTANASVANEYDYFSLGAGGSVTKLFNQKNTELSLNANVFIDSWSTIAPVELRPFGEGENGLNNSLFTSNTITGNANYNPIFNKLKTRGRNTYAAGLGFSQILHKNIQGSLALDVIQQQGQLATPFQRVNFGDVADSFIGNFQLADANELLPGSRTKIALGGRLNWYLNEFLVLRTYYRYYTDNWGVDSHTASLELPIKVSRIFTVYPSFRYYNQTAADYFNPHEVALSTDEFYTSDYDLSKFSANQLGIGVSYTDVFAKAHIGKWGMKSLDVRFYQYDRNSKFSASIFTAGVKFVQD